MRLQNLPYAAGRLWLSDTLFASLPEPKYAGSVLFSSVEQTTGAPALEIRCAHPAGLPWMTLEMMFGESAAAARAATSLGIRFRAKALPPMTVQTRCAFATADGVSITDIDPDIRLTHEFNLVERQMPLAGTRLSQDGAISELRIFLALPRLTYFAAIISHAELFWQ